MQIKCYFFNYILFYIQFKAPWFHSWYTPISKIIKNINKVIDHIIRFDEKKVKIIGRISAISISKIKKIIVIRKNRREKGTRELEIWLKPHSNGDIFSLSIFIFFEIKIDTFITKIEIIVVINVIIKI